jgi:hypothetical protein
MAKVDHVGVVERINGNCGRRGRFRVRRRWTGSAQEAAGMADARQKTLSSCTTYRQVFPAVEPEYDSNMGD